MTTSSAFIGMLNQVNGGLKPGALLLCSLILFLASCGPAKSPETEGNEPVEISIDRAVYQDQLEGFWLAQCIANWTGLITEMDKVGDIGDIRTGKFYSNPDKWGYQGCGTIRRAIVGLAGMFNSDKWGCPNDGAIEMVNKERPNISNPNKWGYQRSNYSPPENPVKSCHQRSG